MSELVEALQSAENDYLSTLDRSSSSDYFLGVERVSKVVAAAIDFAIASNVGGVAFWMLRL